MSVEKCFSDWMDEGAYTDEEIAFSGANDSNSIRGMAYYAGYIAGKKEAQQVIQPDNGKTVAG